ncbi:anti-sigma F factor [Cuneatibacter caecimuris]
MSQMEETRGKKETMRLEIESLSCNEAFARVAVAAFMARMDPTVEEVDDVKTAVSEAVTNCVIHAYGGGEGKIWIQAEVEGSLLTVQVRDSGVGISDVKKAMEPLYTGKPEAGRSGMGFSFMEAFMDEVQVDSVPGEGTVVTMKKKLGQ